MVAIGVLGLVVSQAGQGSTVRKVTSSALGEMTTKAAVVEALDSTGYDLSYRNCPELEGYENISGEASHRGDHVQFAVEIRLDGPYEDLKKNSELDPQPPVIRYGRGLEGGDIVGNVAYYTQQQSPSREGRGIELESNKSETKMAIRIGLALRALFAPKVRPVG